MVSTYKSKKKVPSSHKDPRDRSIRNNKEKNPTVNLEKITQTLKLAFVSKNIDVKVSSRNKVLEISLEGNGKPEQKYCIATIQKKILPLNLSHRLIKIYGKNLNNKVDRWVQEINLKNYCPQCSNTVTYIYRSKKINLKFCTACKWPVNNAVDNAEKFANKVYKLYRSWEKKFLNWYLGEFKKTKKNTKQLAIRIAIPLVALLLVFGISWKYYQQPNYAVNPDASAPSQYFLYKEIQTSADRPTLLWKRQAGVCLYISHYSGFDRDRFAEKIKTEYQVKCVNYLD